MNKREAPDYLFESSWEVCNKVGGIYTVLSTKANTLQEIFNDKVIFIGPDIWGNNPIHDFISDDTLFPKWKEYALSVDDLKLKTGRWNVPGQPPVILIDFTPFFEKKDEIYYEMWNDYNVDSMHAYGDYDESCMFAYATGKVIESFYRFHHLETKNVTALFNEWMLGMGALYIKKHLPSIATLFTTHATSIGRSIAGNNKPLYAHMEGYNGDQMAKELNMEAKHSLEKQAANRVDCFTTVSDITASECMQLLSKEPEIVTPNGFERDFVPSGSKFTAKRKEARNTLINIAEKLLGCDIDPEAFLISTSGRYEYRNKGIDIFIEAMNRIRTSGRLQSEVIAFIMVPAGVRSPRADLSEAVKKDIPVSRPMQMPFLTHWLDHMEEDKILNYIQHIGFTNNESDKLKIIFVPCYLDGQDGIFNKPYYDLLIGMDVTVYPSYYEPWGYTPLESIAFGIPTITTNLAGFGMWALKSVSGSNINEGVAVIDRTDYNYFEVADEITSHILTLIHYEEREKVLIKRKCQTLANKAEWNKFIVYYQEAFHIALEHMQERNS